MLDLRPRIRDISPWYVATTLAVITTGAVMLCWPAFRNGFPLVFSDTGTYIDAFKGTFESLFQPSQDRPNWYSGLIAFFSVRHNLWGVVLAQGWIGAWLIWEMVRSAGVRRPLITTLIICALAAIATPLPWLVSTLMPDVWLAFGFLATAAFCISRTSLPTSILLVGTVFVTCLVGTSHSVILTGTLCALILSRIFMRFEVRRPLVMISACVAAVLVLSAGNWSRFGHFKPVEGSQIFLFARFVQNGDLDRILPQYCKHRPSHPVCRHQKQVLKMHLGKYIVWSPLSNAIDGWKDKHGDLAALNHMVERKKATSLVTRSAWNSLRLFAMQSGHEARDFYRGPYPAWSFPSKILRKRYPRAMGPYLSARQQSESMDSTFTSIWLALCWLGALGSLAYAAAILLRGWLLKRERPPAMILAVIILAASIVNAVVSASLSGVVLRYEARSSAILLILALTCALMQWHDRHHRTATEPEAKPNAGHHPAGGNRSTVA